MHSTVVVDAIVDTIAVTSERVLASFERVLASFGRVQASTSAHMARDEFQHKFTLESRLMSAVK
eukprot:m.65587 g.65587  ORF g.65587 m.65587 type:complete len:64 (-) comp49812_c0_seq2:36-227(-)